MSIYGVEVDHHDDYHYRNYKISQTGFSSATLVSGTVRVDCLNAFARGVDDTNRIGRRLLMKRLQVGFRINLNSNSGTASGGNVVGVAVVYDKQTKGGIPSWLTVFGDATASVAIGNFDPIRYDILWHKLYAVQPSIMTSSNYSESGGETTIVDVINLPLNHFTTFNSGNTGNYTDIQTGALWIMALGSTTQLTYTMVGESTLWHSDA